MTKPMARLPLNRCKNCGKTWIPRGTSIVCPKCHSYRWRTGKPSGIGRPRGVKNKPKESTREGGQGD
jgi:hypothetical protein